MSLINFSIPTIPSFSSTTPDKNPMLFVPDVKYLVKFANGDIGIADGIKKSMVLKNFAKMTSVSQLETFAKASGVILQKDPKEYIKDGRVQFNPEELTFNGESDLSGLKSLEKAMIQSIFESQKPYIEIIKLVTDNLVKIEDIVARVLAVSGSSMKPINNPKAMGYKGNGDLSAGLFKLDNLSKSDKKTISASSSYANTENNKPEYNTSGDLPSGYIGITQSVVYSTGVYDKTVNYTYIYKDIKDDSIKLQDGTASISVPQVDDDGLPTVVVFGIYDKNWNPLSEDDIETNVNWLKRSGKWLIGGQWPQLTSGTDFNYIWTKSGYNDVVGSKPNGDGWEIKRYKENQGTNVNGKSIQKDDPILSYSNLTNDGLTYYKNYYIDKAKIKLDKLDITQSIKDSTLIEITSKINTGGSIETVVESLVTKGFLPYSNGHTNNLNIQRANPYKPYKVVNPQGKSIWIDPEKQYELKIIKCDSSTNIKYLDEVGKPEKSTQIIRFINNNLNIELDDGSTFEYRFYKNGATNKGSSNIFSYDNFDESIYYSLDILSLIPPKKYQNGIEFDLSNGYTLRFKKNIGNWTIESGTYDESGKWATNESDVLPNDISFPNGMTLTFNNGIFQYTNVFSGSLKNYQPNKLEKNSVVISSLDFSFTQNRTILPPNQIRVKDTKNPFGIVISSSQITNNQLAVNTPYSSGLYGTPFVKNQDIEQVYRYATNEDDTRTYYIVEGILTSKNKQKINSNTVSNGDGSDYTLYDVIGSIPVFIDMLIEVFTKLIPAITELSTLIANPTKFITDIIISKLGDNFGTESPKFEFFSKDFTDTLKKLSKIDGSVDEKYNKMKNIVNNSSLKNYVHISKSAVARFILDGSATVKLFGDAPILKSLNGIKFGIETNLSSLASSDPKLPFNLINDGSSPSSMKSIPELSGITNVVNNIKQSALYNTNFDAKLEVKNEIKTQAGGIEHIEEVDIQHSTGVYQKDVDYTYIYVTEYVKKLIDEAQSLENQGDLSKSIDKLNEASKLDPKNQFLIGKLDELKKLTQLIGSQPILDFMLNIVCLPLKVIFGIIKYIMEFFKSLVNPFELPVKIIDFVSFKWMLDFFNPASKNSMFAMSGLLFDIPTFLQVWLPSLKSGTKNSFDLNDIIKIPWVPKLPTYTKDQFKSLIYGVNGSSVPRLLPLNMLTSILCLIEGIINGFIDFVWGLLGLGSLIPNESIHINLCRNSNSDLSPKDIMDLLNGSYFDPSISSAINGKYGTASSNYNFVYSIHTSDGRDIRQLNKIELDKWMLENKDLQFIFET